VTPRLPPGCAARFRPEEEIAQGGYGTVWRARQVELDRVVALKVLDVQAIPGQEDLARFLDEARVTATLAHPHIMVVLDSACEDGVAWIAYEYLPGPSLRGHLERGRIPWPDAFKIGGQIAGALEAAHAAGVIHRDIKPENVLRDGRGEWKVGDFGIARSPGRNSVKTQEGTLLGTPAYIAPEVLRGRQPGPLADVYALGIVLFEMVTGRTPFTGDGPYLVMEAALKQTPPKPSDIVPSLPPEVDTLILNAMARDPAQRTANARTLRELLSAQVTSGGQIRVDELPEESAAPRPEPPPEPPRTVGMSSSPRMTRKTRPERSLPRSTGNSAVVAPPPAPAPASNVRAWLLGGALAAVSAGALVAVGVFIGRRTAAPVPPVASSPAPTSPTPGAPASSGYAENVRFQEEIEQVREVLSSMSPQADDVVRDLSSGNFKSASRRGALLLASDRDCLAKLEALSGRLDTLSEDGPLAAEQAAVNRYLVTVDRFYAWHRVERVQVWKRIGEEGDAENKLMFVDATWMLQEMLKARFPAGGATLLYRALAAIPELVPVAAAAYPARPQVATLLIRELRWVARAGTVQKFQEPVGKAVDERIERTLRTLDRTENDTAGALARLCAATFRWHATESHAVQNTQLVAMKRALEELRLLHPGHDKELKPIEHNALTPVSHLTGK
jgi:serine/threonine protein kinase